MSLSTELVLPEHVAGCLEWSSGLLLINETYETWSMFGKLTHLTPQLGSPLAQLAQTITHEHYHFWQIITTGYLYKFACSLHDEVRRLVKPLVQDLHPDQPRFPELVPEPSPTILDLVSRLDHTGYRYLTPRDIIESAAYLYEWKTHVASLNARMFARHLQKAPQPSPIYRQAYDIAVESLGEAAFLYFLPVAYLSLCFSQPQEAFFHLVEWFRANAPTDDEAEIRLFLPETVQEVTSALSLRQSFLGTSADVLVSSPQYAHPIYGRGVRQVIKLNEHVSVLAIMMDAQALDSRGAIEIVQPCVFKDHRISVPNAYRDRVDLNPDDLHSELFASWIYASIAFKITQKANVCRLREIQSPF